MIVALILLSIPIQLGEAYTTLRALNHGATEVNQAMAWVIAHLGNLGFVLLKLVAGLGLVLLLLHAVVLSPAAALVTAGVLDAGYLYLIVRNWRNG